MLKKCADTPRMSKKHSQRGDTIVEVLIATAIISLVLVLSYATVNRNARVSQETREQTQAVKIAERQVELLRAASLAPTADMPTATKPCFKQDGTDLASIPDDCKFTDVDGSGATYVVDIKKDPLPSPAVYVVSVTWDTLSGNQANVTMRYIP